MDRLRAMRMFRRVAELESFARASEDLGYSTSAGSAMVRELEAHLGVQLFVRTTRRVRLTAEGARYLERLRVILSEIDELEDEIGSAERLVRGRIRVQAPVGLARLVIAPALPGFLAAHPAVEVEVLSRNGLPDFVADDLDAAIFIGEVPERDMVARTLGRVPFVTCAAPVYLERHGVPRVPADLLRHDCIGVLGSGTGHGLEWRFERDGRLLMQPVPARLAFEASDPAVAASVAGGGVLQMIAYLVSDEIAAGRLVPVLTDWLYPGAEIVLLHPRHTRRPRRLRVFEAFVVATMRRFRDGWTPAAGTGGPG